MRLSAVADSRATRKLPWGALEVVTEHTPKLFAAPVRCFDPSALNLTNSVWTNPYYETVVGLGYTGNCFEALAVVAHIQRCFSQLVADDKTSPLPDSGLLAELAGELLDRFINAHKDKAKLTVRFVMFGWTPDREPWIAKFGWCKGAKDTPVFTAATRAKFIAIGTDPGAARAAAALQRSTANKHKRSTGPKDFDAELQVALEHLAVSDTVEQAVNSYLKTPHWASIGGRLEKLEIFPGDGDPCASYAAFTHDYDAPYWNGLSPVSKASGLRYVPTAVNRGP